MPTPEDLKRKLWDAVKDDRVMMLGLAGRDEAHMRPMTGQLDGDEGPIWFFTSIDNDLWKGLSDPGRATAAFVAKDHDLFASLHGSLCRETDRVMVDKLWNTFVAAWYDGKDDPRLTMLRFDADEAQVWEGGSGLISAVKMMLTDPRESFKDQVADVRL